MIIGDPLKLSPAENKKDLSVHFIILRGRGNKFDGTLHSRENIMVFSWTLQRSVTDPRLSIFLILVSFS